MAVKEKRSLFEVIFGKKQEDRIPQSSTYLEMLNTLKNQENLDLKELHKFDYIDI